MLRVGMTGGIATGKSEAARHFRLLGAPVLDADDIVRSLTAKGGDTLAEVVRIAGDDVLDADGRLDRARLRARVFADAGLRRRLEALLHPLARAAMRNWFARQGAPYAICMAPLLLEAGWRSDVDRVLVVHCSDAQQRRRLAARELPAGEAEAILAAQLGAEERLRQADDALDTDGDLARLRADVEALHRRYLGA